MVNTDMMERGNFFNLTLYGIIGFTYLGSALIDFSDCELTLNEVPIHSYTEFSFSFTSRLLCWLGLTVLFPRVPMELFSYFLTCSTKFYAQNTPDWSEKNHPTSGTILQPSHFRLLLGIYKIMSKT